MSAHIDADAPGLASLPEGDAERIAAYEHAKGCPPCAKALEEAERLLSLLDAAPGPPPPSDAALRRAWKAVETEMDASPSAETKATNAGRAQAKSWAALAVAASALFAFLDARGHAALAVGVGVECLLMELGTAAVTVGVAKLVIENRAGIGRAPNYAALAAWSAFVAQVYLHFRCPVSHEAGHLVVFHLGGVVLAALFGGPAGARLARRAT